MDTTAYQQLHEDEDNERHSIQTDSAHRIEAVDLNGVSPVSANSRASPPSSHVTRQNSQTSHNAVTAALLDDASWERVVEVEQDVEPAGIPPAPDVQSPPEPLSRTPSTQSYATFASYTSKLQPWKERIQYSLSPSTHNLLPTDTASVEPKTTTARVYHYWGQTRRLWRLAAGEWLLTTLLCGVYAGILYRYAHDLTIDNKQKLWINTLTTAVSVFLGINLAASLRSYAKLLRWLMLAQKYRSLETFDLVLGCDSLYNVLKLLLKDRNLRYKFLPSTTQILCVFWIVVNLAMAILVGMINLTYSLGSDGLYTNTRNGVVTTVDMSALDTGVIDADRGSVQNWGIRGFTIDPFWDFSYADAFSDSFQSLGNGSTMYWFADYNAGDTSLGVVALRYIESTSYCESYNVVSGGDGNSAWISYDDGSGTLQTVLLPVTAVPGALGVTAISNYSASCGDRCTPVDMFIAGNTTDADGETDAQYFKCNNTLGLANWMEGTEYVVAPDDYQFSDHIAALLAGAVGWSGQPANRSDDSWQAIAYHNPSDVVTFLWQEYMSPNMTSFDMADFVASFTMKAITAMADPKTGIRQWKDVKGRVPVLTEVLDVDWKNAILILAGIPGLQLLTLVLVFLFANRAIIKDDSPLAMAKLYHHLLRAHGLHEKGCMLSGDKMIDAMGNPRVIYGWDSRKGEPEKEELVGCLDVFEESSGVVHKPFRRYIKYD